MLGKRSFVSELIFGKPMFLRTYRHDDKKQLQQLFFDTVHTVNIRDYSPEQLDAWAPAEHDRDVWARLDQQFCYVIECQKMLVGFVSITHDGVLDFLYVHKDFQGKGIATALLKQVERLARKKGITRLRAETSITACGFFEKNGFVMLGENKKIVRGQEMLNYIVEKPLPQSATGR